MNSSKLISEIQRSILPTFMSTSEQLFLIEDAIFEAWHTVYCAEV